MNNEENVFITGDKLPWVHEAVLAIINVAPGGSAKKEKESKACRDAINTYVIEVERLWINAFGGEHVCERKTIAKKLRAALQDSSTNSVAPKRKVVPNVRFLSSGRHPSMLTLCLTC